jgi:hypothetical protein
VLTEKTDERIIAAFRDASFLKKKGTVDEVKVAQIKHSLEKCKI